MQEVNLTEDDIKQLYRHGLEPKKALMQIGRFIEGFPPLDLQKPATLANGIAKLDQETIDKATERYNQAVANKKQLIKFVPASGAATRMFKDLFAFLNTADENKEAQPEGNVKLFFDRITEFAFYPALAYKFKKLYEFEMAEALKRNMYAPVLKTLLLPDGLNYGRLPKGLLGFHKSDGEVRTPAHEHLIEAIDYALEHNRLACLHFTVSPEHMEAFKKHLETVSKQLEDEKDVNFMLEYSVQKPHTDVVAATLDNQPFRLPNGELLIRPGGHGALIENLNDIDADLIFIKNIDNVVPDTLKPTTTIYKKALAGLLFQYQEKAFELLRRFDAEEENPEGVTDNLLSDAGGFLINEIGVLPPEGLLTLSKEHQALYLRQKLNRPIRVCGMVQSEGDTGGGPFWCKNRDGSISVQIVETAQIKKNDPQQMALQNQVTHFSPADFFCGVRNYLGHKFDLTRFIDHEAGFITHKSKDGRELKAQELPGLWNGAMSDWNTICVDVPLITFNPVKSVTDLLNPQHQGKTE